MCQVILSDSIQVQKMHTLFIPPKGNYCLHLRYITHIATTQILSCQFTGCLGEEKVPYKIYLNTTSAYLVLKVKATNVIYTILVGKPKRKKQL